MDTRPWVRVYRVIFPLMALVAMGYALNHSYNNNPDFRVSNFFSFFTIQSNIFGSLVLLYAAWKSTTDTESHRFAMVRGAAVLYLATTGIVYGILLSGYQEELNTAQHWVDTVVHRIMPLVMVADWLIVTSRPRIEYREALWWIVYPLAYCAYSLIRGPIVDWYPYPFLDPDEAGGYGAVGLYCLVIAAGMILFGAIVVLLSRRGEQQAAEVSMGTEDLVRA
jgi:cytochrome bd-type quinol oxidase subunit 2